MSFEKSLAYTLQNEGGFTIDDGGPTMCGLTIPDVAEYMQVPEKSISETMMKNLSPQMVRAIYQSLYWNKMNLNKIISDNVATCIFDIGVNRGVYWGVKYAQIISDVEIDGMMGNITANAVNSMKPYDFITEYANLVKSGYREIVQNNPEKYQKYLQGWLNRSDRLLSLAAASVL